MARKLIGPRPAKPQQPAKADDEPAPRRKRGGYRPWAELLRRTLALDFLECPACKGRMKLVAMITEPSNIARFLTALGEPTDDLGRSPNQGPPYWKSTVLRRKALRDAAQLQEHPGPDQRPEGDVCPRHPDAPLGALCDARGPPLRFTAPHFFAQRSAFFYLRAPGRSRRDPSAARAAGATGGVSKLWPTIGPNARVDSPPESCRSRAPARSAELAHADVRAPRRTGSFRNSLAGKRQPYAREANAKARAASSAA
ncbi:hypothetical protein [Sorangium sp. So ce117]|uniref:hypothetical protein n=1 Tax=Sorangium sp. So ce117 TaxID=3133277 RepID=UPI003F60EF0D